MRVYLDNCCYNRPFDDQSQVKVRVETISKLAVQLMIWRCQMQMTDNELTVRCMNILMDNVGPVDAERFVSIVNLNHFDYTEWRKDHLFVGETVDTLVDKIRAFEREHPELAEKRHA